MEAVPQTKQFWQKMKKTNTHKKTTKNGISPQIIQLSI